MNEPRDPITRASTTKPTGLPGARVDRFLGVRYAKPPTGQRRFRPPEALDAGEETTDATAFGNRNFQVGVLEAAVRGRAMPGAESEDCLFLNIYAPAPLPDTEPLPVMVWIHGGAFTSGSGNEYDPTRLVERNDVVVVTVNYRLNLFGFINLSRFGADYAASSNLGILDQIAALRWVSKHIEVFGGDASNVTVMGQSAGATSVFSLLSAPSAEGLFHKVVAMSGGEIVRPPADPLDVIKGFLGVETDEACLERLLAMSPQELLELQASAGLPIGPSIDGTVLVRRPRDAVKSGWASAIPVLTGTTRDDGTLLAPAFAADERIGALYVQALAADIDGSDGAGYLQYLETLMPNADLVEKLSRVWVDFFRASSVRVAASASMFGAGGWVYSFEVPTNHPLGVTHFSEVPFVFRWVDEGNPGLFVHPATPENERLAEVWSGTLVRFAQSGSPNGAGLPSWPKFEPRQLLTMIVRPGSTVVEHPAQELMELYGVR